MHFDALGAADGLHAGVEKKKAGANGDEDAEEGEERGLADEGLGGGEDAGEKRGLNFGGFKRDGIGGIENNGGIAGEVVQVHVGEGGEWVGVGVGGRVVGCAAIVDDVGVEDAVGEFGEGGHEDGGRVGEDGEERALGVAEGIDEEELSAGGGDGARAEDVPDAVVDADEGGADAEVGGCEGGEVDRLNLVEVVAEVEEANGIASDQAAEGVADDADFLELGTGFLEVFDVVLHLLCDALATEVNSIVGEVADVGFGNENVQFVLGMFFAQPIGHGVQVFRTAPETVDVRKACW